MTALLLLAVTALRIDPIIPEGHVRTLAHPNMEGRMTLTDGMYKSSDYIAREFKSYGLKPGGNDGWFHLFDVTANQKPGAKNAARFWRGSEDFLLEMGKDYVPLMGSKHMSLTTGEVLFVGSKKADEVQNVAGKWVLMYRTNGAARVAAYAAAGAKGVVLAGPTGPNGLELPKFVRGQGISAQAGLPAIAITRDAFTRVTGLKWGVEPGSERTGLNLRAITDLVPNAGKGRNVIGVLPGNDPTLKNEYVIIGGHYDHLGYGETGSRTGSDEIHNGADDNASGTAGVLALAEYFANNKANRRTYIFQLYTGEELGLLGARAWVRDYPEILKQTQVMINMDMIGRLREEGLTVFCVNSAPNFSTILDSMQVDGVKINKIMSSPGNSDHAAFIAARVPSLFFNTGLHAEYHTENDKTGTINFQGISQVLEIVAGSIEQIDQLDTRLTFVGTAAPAGGDPNRARRARVGFIPDMTSEDPRGMRISGVSPGSPAESAGIKAGDILVSFDGKAVPNIEALQEVLTAAKAGVAVKVVVLRGDQRLELSLTPAAPQS